MRRLGSVENPPQDTIARMDTGEFSVRSLSAGDASDYFAIRREMLGDSAWAYGSSPEDDRIQSVDDARRMLDSSEHIVVAGFEGARLLSVGSMTRVTRIKRAHEAEIWGVYTRPEGRGRGLGRRCMATIIEIARSVPGLDVLNLSVSDRAAAAHALYRSLGFVEWGTQPDCIRVNGVRHALIHMRMDLRAEGERVNG